MKRILTTFAILALSTFPALAQNPQETVDQLIVARKAQDEVTVTAAFTEDAGYAYSLDGRLNRGVRFDRWIETDITGPGSVFLIESATVEGDTVDALVLWGRGGNATNPARYVFTVIDGKIDSWRVTGR